MVAAKGVAVQVTRHPSTRCWLIRKDDGSWMHFAGAGVSEQAAKTIVLANVPDCRQIDVVDYNNPDGDK